jgi:hypothetical protein
VTEAEEWGRVPLHYAAMERSIEAVRQHLKQTGDPNPRDHEGWTPLLFAGRSANPDVLALLLDAGARIDAVTNQGHPALYWAIAGSGQDPTGAIRILRLRGADPTARTMQGHFGLKSPLDHLRRVEYGPEIRAEFADLLRPSGPITMAPSRPRLVFPYADHCGTP